MEPRVTAGGTALRMRAARWRWPVCCQHVLHQRIQHRGSATGDDHLEAGRQHTPRELDAERSAWTHACSVLVESGETVELLISMSNRGLWKARCHVAEHIESGMMLSFLVDDGSGIALTTLEAHAGGH